MATGGKHRKRLVLVVFCALILAAQAIGAMVVGRLGWSNYWGGFVYAPFALIIAILLILVAVKPRTHGRSKRRTR